MGLSCYLYPGKKIYTLRVIFCDFVTLLTKKHIYCFHGTNANQTLQRDRGSSPSLVWDLDSKLPIPAPLTSYESESVKSSFQLFPEFQR